MFVDGAFVPELSDLAALEPGLTIGSMAQALAAGDPRWWRISGKLVPTDDVGGRAQHRVHGRRRGDPSRGGRRCARPIHLVFVNAGKAAGRGVRRARWSWSSKGARAMLVESHDGPDGGDDQVNTALELVVGDEAQVDHVKITGEGAGALHVSTLMAAIGAHARFNEFLFTTGGAVVRNQTVRALRRRGHRSPASAARACSRAASMPTPRWSSITRSADCASREVFKSVLDDESRGVFQGKIIVRPDAQKTDAKMVTHALLLSDDAEADNKPELEIFADDVQCGHGATAGALDEDLLFYLRARGIPEKEAEALLIQAFVGEAVEAIEHEGLRDALMDAAPTWLEARG